MTSEVLKGKQMAKNLPKGKKVESGFSRLLGCFSCFLVHIEFSFRQTTTRHSIIRFLVFRDGSDRHQVEFGLLSCCE